MSKSSREEESRLDRSAEGQAPTVVAERLAVEIRAAIEWFRSEQLTVSSAEVNDALRMVADGIRVRR